MPREANNLLGSSIRRLIRAGRPQQLKKIVRKTHPADLGHLFGALTPEQRMTVFDALEDRESRAELLTELGRDVLEDMLEHLPDERLVLLLREMPPDDATDLLQGMESSRKDGMLELMSLDEQSEATSLMGYPPDSAGGLMSTDFLALHESTTAAEAVAELQRSDDAEIVFYLYVVNDVEQLVGVISLRDLVQQIPTTPISQFMIRDVIRVESETDQEEVARIVARYNLLALPVVEDNNRLVGVVTVDDIIDVIRTEATEDIFLMAGAGEEGEVGPRGSAFASARSRLPWMFPSFLAGALGVFVVSMFSGQLKELLPLATLIPMIMGLAGNIGKQSATIVTRGLAVGALDFVQIGRVVGKEFVVGVFTGVVYGTLIGMFASVYFLDDVSVQAAGTLRFGGVISISVLTSMVLAAVIGATIPLVFHRIGKDPALASGPFVSTSIDVFAILIYFATASIFIA